MKQLILLTLLIVTSAAAIGQTRFGAGLETDLDALALQGKGQTFFDENWGAQLGFTLYMGSPNPTRIDAEGIYNMAWIGGTDNIELSLIGGLNYWYSGVKGTDRELGINAGAQLRVPVSGMHIYLEPKFSIISNANFLISAGVFF